MRNEKPFVYSNPANLAILAALPSAEVLGGVKMASYWSEVERLIDLAAKRSGLRNPTSRDFRSRMKSWKHEPHLLLS